MLVGFTKLGTTWIPKQRTWWSTKSCCLAWSSWIPNNELCCMSDCPPKPKKILYQNSPAWWSNQKKTHLAFQQILLFDRKVLNFQITNCAACGMVHQKVLYQNSSAWWSGEDVLQFSQCFCYFVFIFPSFEQTWILFIQRWFLLSWAKNGDSRS